MAVNLSRLRRVPASIRTIREILEIARERKIDFVAGGITYYEFFSLVPLLLLSFTVLSMFGGEQTATQLILLAGDFLPEVGQNLVRDVLTQETGQSSTIIGVLILIWATIQLFRSFDIAFSQIYQTDRAETLFEEVEDAFTALITISLAILLTVTLGAVITAYPRIQFVGVAWTLAHFAGLTLVFIPLYHVFTDIHLPLRSLLPGAVVAAAGWTVLQTMFQIYSSFVGGSIYSVFGGILLLIIWMYVGNILLLLGAVINLVHHRHSTG